MTRQIAEWLWRAALIALLVWIGAELHLLRVDVQPGPAEGGMTAGDPGGSAEELLQSLDELRGDVADLNQKVDALLASMRL
jgi:hypothetical protein